MDQIEREKVERISELVKAVKMDNVNVQWKSQDYIVEILTELEKEGVIGAEAEGSEWFGMAKREMREEIESCLH